MFTAPVLCSAYGNVFDASVLTDGTARWNYQSYFFRVLGRVSDADAETIADSLASDLLVAVS